MEEKTFIYFIASSADQVKIGRSHNPITRMRDLQNQIPAKLELLGVIWDEPEFEKKLHTKFSRWRKQGEWFERCAEIEEYVVSYAKPYNDLLPIAKKHQRKAEERERKRQERESIRFAKQKYSWEIQTLAKHLSKHMAKGLISHIEGQYFDVLWSWFHVCRDTNNLLNRLETQLWDEEKKILVNADWYHKEIRRMCDAVLGCDWRTSKYFLYQKKSVEHDDVSSLVEEQLARTLRESISEFRLTEICKKLAGEEYDKYIDDPKFLNEGEAPECGDEE